MSHPLCLHVATLPHLRDLYRAALVLDTRRHAQAYVHAPGPYCMSGCDEGRVHVAPDVTEPCRQCTREREWDRGHVMLEHVGQPCADCGEPLTAAAYVRREHGGDVARCMRCAAYQCAEDAGASDGDHAAAEAAAMAVLGRMG